MAFNSIPIDSLELKPFHKLDKEWALLTAGNSESVNTMTVSWGFLGTLWDIPAATVYARPQRYTREFLEREGYYTLSFFPAEYKKDLTYLGKVSGRDEDKIAKAGLSVLFDDTARAPFFEQAELVLVCRKLYTDDIKPELFVDTAIEPAKYPKKDYHRFYIGEVVEVLRKEA